MVILWPFSLLYLSIVSVRRFCYQKNYFASTKLPVPTIVVGNITVGGTGKTPLTIALFEHLKKEGFKPGIVSRGYKSCSENDSEITVVTEKCKVCEIGDEPFLIYQRTKAPMVVGKNRVKAAQTLLEKFDCNLIISDDGLQHYALKRDIEIAVIDGQRLLGNGFCLPVGPLRETIQRLATVDFVVATNPNYPYPRIIEIYKPLPMSLKINSVYKSNNPKQTKSISSFQGKKVHALAAIANPERFFTTLRRLGLNVIKHPYPDHHNFSEDDFTFTKDETILITEKDAVKCQNLKQDNIWVVAIEADLDELFLKNLLLKLSPDEN